MSKTLTLNTVSVNVPWDYEQAGYPGNAKDISSISYSGPQLTNGVGAGEADIKYSEQLTIAESGNTTLNLSSLTDSFGNSISFTRIKELYIENSSLGSASSIKVGGAVSNAFNAMWQAPGTANNDAFIPIRNGACLHLGVAQDATAYVVGSAVNILITNLDGANAATVNVVIVGCDS